MIKKLSRYKKQITLFLCAILVLSGSVCSFSFETEAASAIVVEVPYAEPKVVSNNQGYVNVFVDNGSGYSVFTYFWTVFATKNGYEVPVEMCVDVYMNSITLTPMSDSADEMWFSLGWVDSNVGAFNFFVDQSGGSYWIPYDVVGAEVGGNGFVDVRQYVGVGGENFDIKWADSEEAKILRDIYALLLTSNITSFDILEEIEKIFAETEDMNEALDKVYQYVNYTYYEVYDIRQKMAKIIEEFEESNSWLEKIWNSIQSFLSPDSEDKEATDEFQEESSSQSDKMNELNEQNKTNKVDVGSASADVDASIDFENVGNYGAVLSVITENEYVLQMLMVVVAVSLIAYVLFGKK